MRTWQIQSARSHFSEVFDAALGGEPQRVTRHGRHAVVVVSEDEWSRHASGADDGFGKFLADFPHDVGELPRRRRQARVLRDQPF